MKFNKSKVEEFVEWKEGVYTVQVTDKTVERVSRSGKEMVELQLKVISDFKKGATLRDFVVDGDWVDTKIDSVLRGLGVNPDTFTDDFNPAAVIGKTGKVEVVMKAWQNEEKGTEGVMPNVKKWVESDTLVESETTGSEVPF